MTTTTTTTTTSSGPSLQILSEAAASSWLLQWSGLVGLVAARDGNAGSGTEHKTLLELGKSKRATPNFHSTHRSYYFRQDGASFPRVLGHKESSREARRYGKGSVRLRYENLDAEMSPKRSRQDLSRIGHVSSCSAPLVLNPDTVDVNARRCSSYLTSHLPPLLLHQVMDTAWRTLSEEVTLGGREDNVPDHRVKEWCRKMPVLVRVGMRVTNARYVLDLTGLPHDSIQQTIAHLDKHLPVDLVSGVMLPKGKQKHGGHVIDSSVLRSLLYRSRLISLSLNLDLVDKSVLRDVSRLSLHELNISGGRHSDREVMQDFCGIPLSATDQVTDGFNCDFRGLPVTRLGESLRRLTVSLPGVSSGVYTMFLSVFQRLQHYNPPSGAGASVSGHARMKPDTNLNLVSLNLGHASRHEILQVSRTCPNLRDVSLSVNFDCKDTLNALSRFKWLSGIQVSYYPASVSAAPKINANVLLPFLNSFANQLLSVGLAGFSLKGDAMGMLAMLPDLRRLHLSDCWLSCPGSTHNPFPSLDALSLTFLPSLEIMRVLTAGYEVRSIDIHVPGSESPGNALTDEHVRQLVMSGTLRSVHSLNASSPYLTLASLRHLAKLPGLRSVGVLSRWGVTQEELKCVGHSGPSHIICHA